MQQHEEESTKSLDSVHLDQDLKAHNSYCHQMSKAQKAQAPRWEVQVGNPIVGENYVLSACCSQNEVWYIGWQNIDILSVPQVRTTRAILSKSLKGHSSLICHLSPSFVQTDPVFQEIYVNILPRTFQYQQEVYNNRKCLPLLWL